jgi:hypothetical protein
MPASSARARGTPAPIPPEFQNLPFTQPPILPRTTTVRLSSTALRLLGILGFFARGSQTCQVTDQDLGQEIDRSEQTVQRLLLSLETQGLISRLRRRGQRKITLRFSLRRRNQPTHALLTQGQASEDSGVHASLTNKECNPRNQGVQPSVSRGSPDPSYFEAKTPSSSQKGETRGGDDDDESAAPPADQDHQAAALAFVAEVLGATVANQLRADAPRLGRQIAGRWDCVTAAAAMAARRQGCLDERRKLKDPRKWILITARDYAANGISAEAAAEVQECRRKAEVNAQARATAAARDQARHQAKAQVEAEQADIAQVLDQLAPAVLEDLVRRAVAELPEPVTRRNPTLTNPFVRGKVYELARQADAPRPVPPAEPVPPAQSKPAAGSSAKNPRRPREGGTLPDSRNCTSNHPPGQDNSTGVKHNVH